MNKVAIAQHPEIKKLIAVAFPNNRKRDCYLNEFRPMNINSYWDSGSRDEYRIVHLETNTVRPLPTSTHPYFEVVRAGIASRENDAVSVDHVGNITLKILPEGFALVRGGVCFGKPATPGIYLNPENMTKLLPGK